MIKKIDITDVETAKEVLKLQKESYQIEAEIINYFEIPPLKDTLATLIKCEETFYSFVIENSIAGIISYKIANKILDIHRVAVHPNHFRKGIASKLVKFVESLDDNFSKIEVCTGQMNKPAIKLYTKCGYKKIMHIELTPTLTLTKFEKRI